MLVKKMSAPNLNFLRSFPAFVALRDEGSRIYVQATLKRPRTVPHHDDDGLPIAYLAGFVDGPGGREESVYAFLASADGKRLAPGAPRPLKAAIIEGLWTDHIVTIGFCLRDCTVCEEA